MMFRIYSKSVKKKRRSTVTVDPALPLRGYLICPKYGKALTGSASKGHNQRYHHYPRCTFHEKAPEVNAIVPDKIRKYVRPLPFLELYKEVIVSIFKNKTKYERSDITQLKNELEETNERLTKARNLLIAGDSDPKDYRILKLEIEERINRLEAKLTTGVKGTASVEPLLNKAISHISQLATLYEEGTTAKKREIIGSIFPKKLTFDRIECRTTRINEALRAILLFYKGLNSKKKGQISCF